MGVATGETALSHAVSWLRAAIIGGDLRPGQRVIQDRVAESTGLSVAPVREALRVLEQEGQLDYIPRRGYFVTRLEIADLEEIYALRAILEPKAIRVALPQMDEEDFARMRAAADECAEAAMDGAVSQELAANRSFHFSLMEAPGQSHLLRLIAMLWDSTEAYRALYYNFPDERQAAVLAHEGMMDAAERGAVEEVIGMQDAHRDRALVLLRGLLAAGDRMNGEAR